MAGNKNLERRPSTVTMPVPGSLNADATESSMPKGDYIEMRNFRKPHTNIAEVRSGYKLKELGDGIPVGAAEYRLDDQYVNVLFYQFGSGLNAFIYDGDRVTELLFYLPITNGHGAINYEVQAVQFNTFLVLTVYNVGVFGLFPTATDLTAWDVRELGKTESPVPNSLSYAAQVTGDLIVYEAVVPHPNNGTDCKPVYGTAQNEPVKTRVPMSAPYFRVGDPGSNGVNLQSTNLVKQFEPESVSALASDNSPHFQTGTTQRAVGTKYHAQKRGWFYKTIVKRQYTDIRGQKITVYDQPSVDFFVPDNHYAPPFVCHSTAGAAPFFALDHTDASHFDPEATSNPFIGALFPASGDLRTMPDIGATNPFPLVAPHNIFSNFIALWRKYFHDSAGAGDASTQPEIQDPFFFTSVVMGYISTQPNPFTPPNVAVPAGYFWYMYPYKISVPISELLGAPQTVFDWSLFSGLPSDAIEIGIYRTAHTDSAQFAPNIYGLAGTLSAPGTGSSTFTDSTADWNLDFNGRTDSQVGYLEDEFSGKVIRIEDNNIRLGDTVTHLKIRKPSPLVQAFAFDGGDLTPILTKTDLTTLAFDGLPNVAFAYQYADDNSYVSDLTTFSVDTTGAADSNVGVAFTFPHGYNDTITNIYVFEGRVISGVRVWRRARGADGNTTVDPKDGHFIYPGYLGWDLMPLAANPDDIVSKDRGACIYSEESDMFFWPPENFELEDEFNPVTAINNTVGPTLVLTDTSQVQTTFGVDNRWEKVSDNTGCISRQCVLKMGRPVFYLSAGGMMITEGYGVRPFPAATQELIRKYLLEEISGQPSLANMRRASLGWLERRKELWLRLPSSADIGGTMPAVTIIYQFFLDNGTYSPQDAQNYTFDIIPNDPGTPVFFISSKRGRLFAFFNNGDTMLFVDCDVESVPWNSDAYLTIPLSLGMTDIEKELEGISLTTDINCKLDIVTGMRRTDGIENDITHGLLKPECEIIAIDPPLANFRQSIYQPVVGTEIENIVDFMPLVRIHTQPADDGSHMFRLQAVSVQLAEKEDAYKGHV